MNKPHKHVVLIKAWADGAIIQYKSSTGKWEDCIDNIPTWNVKTIYRIKPEQSDVGKYGVELGDIWWTSSNELNTVTDLSGMEDAIQGNDAYCDNVITGTQSKLVYLVFRRNLINRLSEFL